MVGREPQPPPRMQQRPMAEGLGTRRPGAGGMIHGCDASMLSMRQPTGRWWHVCRGPGATLVREAALRVLACPSCGGPFTGAGWLAPLPRGPHLRHRQGGVRVDAAGAAPGAEADTREMVQARQRLLGGGAFAPLTRALVEAAADTVAGVSGTAGAGSVVDIGGGTGHHLAGVLDAWPAATGIVLDLSREAARIAARAHPRLVAVVCDVRQRLPIRDGDASLVLDVFAPRAATEMRRMLAPTGRLLVVTPTERHLGELAGVPGMLRVDPHKQLRLDRSLGGAFLMSERRSVEWRMSLDRAGQRDLVAMGPSAHHVTADGLPAALGSLPDPMTITGSVELSIWRPA